MTDRLEPSLVALRQILRATEISSRALAKECGLTPSQLILMQVIAKEGDAMPSFLAKEVSLSQATVTALLDKLEKRKLIIRERDPNDKRRIHVKLTHEGHTMLYNAPNTLQQRFERGFVKMDDWEQAFLLAALERTAVILEAEELDAAPVLDIGAVDSLTE
ncbi:MarR family winged helix-turn-helix transcriptional regulator [Kordiimonas sp. SCSIO 12610]|uniref:MarR family winged helix-turn-helix transcriptional regulator n=1 Tax=Kordiimonas sp. SCSIO 12610 TaxID=2829597 RepID=UPI00210941EB|nr:MarR family transcriptional regulator [Kordiimonas sp. SCSIO 12610]UTW54678.1 MarR family transcriptional regulator [Kordiimonas sp. SCSIO 12610]